MAGRALGRVRRGGETGALMHLTDEELQQQKAGTFLPDLCDHVPEPEKLVTLAPGESYKMRER